MKKILSIIAILSAFACVNAEILMPRVFSDYMVLQREMPVKIWGKAEMNASVKVEFAGKAKEAKADAQGNWALHLDKMPANANNQAMKVYENGTLSKEFKDILIGEVWIAGGQSNMDRTFASDKLADGLGKRATNPMMRAFLQTVPLWKGCNPIKDKEDLTPNFDTPKGSMWNLTTEAIVPSYSQVAFYFAEKLIEELGVPVGIVQTSLGGSKMISWIAKEDLKGTESFVEGLKTFENDMAKFDPSKVDEPKPANTKNPRNIKEPKGIGWYRESPALMYNTKIAPIVGFTARGFIWYQGESDAAAPDFFAMFESVINNWRKYWNVRDMPFYAVQLASFENKNDWANVRWQQYLVGEKLDDVEVLINIDTGVENNIHPTDKDIVGARLANLALAETYDIDRFEDYVSPTIDEVEYKGNTVEVEFDTESDLKLVGNFRGFEVFVDNAWQNASLVELKADKIVLKGNGEILGVRYLWKSWAKPDACLYNKFDLPAMSFIDLKK
ncbi:MAG: sialate O-acetylesterase [Opitutales bacterium]